MVCKLKYRGHSPRYNHLGRAKLAESAWFQGVVSMASDRGCESSSWSQFGVENRDKSDISQYSQESWVTGGSRVLLWRASIACGYPPHAKYGRTRTPFQRNRCVTNQSIRRRCFTSPCIEQSTTRTVLVQVVTDNAGLNQAVGREVRLTQNIS